MRLIYKSEDHRQYSTYSLRRPKTVQSFQTRIKTGLETSSQQQKQTKGKPQTVITPKRFKAIIGGKESARGQQHGEK